MIQVLKHGIISSYNESHHLRINRISTQNDIKTINRQITKLVLVCGLILSINLKGIQAQKLPEVHFEEWKMDIGAVL